MTSHSALRLAGGAARLCAILACTTPALAQTQYDVIHAFQGLPGRSLAPLLPASNGLIYGTTTAGGRHGIGGVFVFNPGPQGGFGVTMLHEFLRAEGGAPTGGLAEGPDGALYGTTVEHGPGGLGTIFRITTTGGFSVLHAFSGPDGARPRAGLTLGSDGNFYGITGEGGAHGFGTIFRMSPAGTLTVLRSLESGRTLNAVPLVRGEGSSLYGTDGLNIFELELEGAMTVLRPGGAFPLGDNVLGLTRAAGGELYFLERGLAGPLIFFRLTLDGVTTPLHTFDAAAEGDGTDAVELSEKADGSFVGTLPLAGPYDRGTAFRVTTSGDVDVLHAFTPARGRSTSGLVTHANGLSYGVTSTGGLGGFGVLYSLTAAGDLFVRHHFTANEGDGPASPPVRGPDGALYGTTANGGLFNAGTVYRLTDAGLQVIHAFHGGNGSYPFGRLLNAGDGWLYGTTHSGGPTGRGSIFRISPAGTFELLHSFTAAEGRHPYGGLILAADGNFWGTTAEGGVFDRGTVFTLTRGGSLSTRHSFGALTGFVPGPSYPTAALVQAADGALYGTIYAGGFIGRGGSAFRLVPGLPVEILFSYEGRFDPTGGSWGGWLIYGGLVEASDGSMYGAGCCGRATHAGQQDPDVFRLAENGARVPLASFAGAAATLIEGADSAIYGLGAGDPSTGSAGTFFRVTAGGTFTLLRAFLFEEAANASGLIEIAPGEFIGTAVSGGPSGRGVIFRLRPGPGN